MYRRVFSFLTLSNLDRPSSEDVHSNGYQSIFIRSADLSNCCSYKTKDYHHNYEVERTKGWPKKNITERTVGHY